MILHRTLFAGLSLTVLNICALLGCNETSHPAPIADGARRDAIIDRALTDRSLQDRSYLLIDVSTIPHVATHNSGALCTPESQCPGGDAERCIVINKNKKGVCLGKCVPNDQNPADPSNVCPVNNAQTQTGVCGLGLTDDLGQFFWSCYYLCQAQSSAGEIITRECPTSTDFTCEVLDPSEPDTKLCLPK